MAPVPPGGLGRLGCGGARQRRPGRLATPSTTGTGACSSLEDAWKADDPVAARQLLGKAVVDMFELKEPSQWLMDHRCPAAAAAARYGPEFRFVKTEEP